MDKNVQDNKNKIQVSLDVQLVWGLTSEDREVLSERSNEEIIIEPNKISDEERSEKFYKNMYDTIKKARLKRGEKNDPFFWVTK